MRNVGTLRKHIDSILNPVDVGLRRPSIKELTVAYFVFRTRELSTCVSANLLLDNRYSWVQKGWHKSRKRFPHRKVRATSKSTWGKSSDLSFTVRVASTLYDHEWGWIWHLASCGHWFFLLS